MKVKNNNIHRIVKPSIILSFIFCSIIFSAIPASAVDNTYYWIPSSGAIGSSGFSANWGHCNAQPTSYKVTTLSSTGFTCKSDRLTLTSSGDQFLAIYPIAYSSDTQIRGKTGATFYLSSQKKGYTAIYRFDLGYAKGGVFTSLGNVTSSISSFAGQIYAVNLSSIIGTAPASSYPALKVSVTTSNGGRIYLGTNGGSKNSNSGRFYVNETVESAPRYNVTISASPASTGIYAGNYYRYNITVNNTGNTKGNYTLSVTDSDTGNFTSSKLGTPTMQITSGGSAMTTLNVTARPSATTGALDNTTVTVISDENSAYTNSTRVQATVVSAPRYDVSIRASPTSSDITPGNSYLYNITVNNTGNANGNYNLSVADSDTGNFTSSTLGITTMQINSSGSAMTTLTVTARSSATIGSIDNTTVTVISVENPAYTNSTRVQTTDSGPTYNVSIIASPISSSITAGNSYLYTITVNNTGNTNGNYTLTVTDTDTGNFTGSILGITALQLNSGGIAMTTLNVTARTSAITGAIDNTTVTVISVENPAYSNSTRVETTIASVPVQGPNCLACHAGAE